MAYQNGVTPTRYRGPAARRTSKAARILRSTVITLAAAPGVVPESGPAQSATRAHSPRLAATLRQRVSTDANHGAPEVVAQIADANEPGYRHARLSSQRRLHRGCLAIARVRRPNTSPAAIRRPRPPTTIVTWWGLAAKPLEYTIGTPPDGAPPGREPSVAARISRTPGWTAGPVTMTNPSLARRWW